MRQLQAALEASRRRCALLELQVTGAAPGTPGAGPRGGVAGVSERGLQELLAQSALHHSKYKQLREDYNRLLNKCAWPGVEVALPAGCIVAR